MEETLDYVPELPQLEETYLRYHRRSAVDMSMGGLMISIMLIRGGSAREFGTNRVLLRKMIPKMCQDGRTAIVFPV